MLALALCHNVTPVKAAADPLAPAQPQPQEYQASSPDEIALVKFAEEVNCKLVYRDQEKVVITIPSGEEDSYEIMLDFPFSSESKRMGIVLRHQKSGRIVFFVKGAEQVICTKVSEESASKIKEAAENLSLEGLRTLAFAERRIGEEAYKEWRKRYGQACAAESLREEKKGQLRDELEKDLEYIGVTGVEGIFCGVGSLRIDTLQDNVASAVEGLKQAGIRVWMLTGDKVETACCIGISSGFKSRSEKYVDLRDLIGTKTNLGYELRVYILLYSNLG